jgi:hypothetical protein
MCGSIDNGVGLLISLFSSVIVHWVEFSIINWLYCVSVGASVINIA